MHFTLRQGGMTMSQSAIGLTIVYVSVVYILSIISIKLHIIKRPFIKKVKMSFLLYIAAIFLFILGIYLYRYSIALCILFCSFGIAAGVLKVSSEILYAKDERKSREPEIQKIQDMEFNPESVSVTKKEEYINSPASSSDINIANAQYIQENISLNVVSCRRSLFIYPYMILKLCLYLCIITFIFSVIVTVMEILFDKAKLDNIARFFKIIASFDFGNKALHNLSGAVIAAYSIAIGIVSLILSLVFGLILRIHIKCCSIKKAVQPLLPGRKKGFIPCSEGIYKLCYRNLKLGSSFYYLYTWGNLSLYAVHDQKNQIVLKAGKIRMPLLLWGADRKLYENIKAIVLNHLPKDRQIIPLKNDRYHLAKVVIAVLVIIALQSIFAFWLDSATIKTSGKRDCDVGGSIHLSYKKAFSSVGYTYQVYEQNSKKVKHIYCELHGTIFMILHPVFHIQSISTLIHENKFSSIVNDPIICTDMLIIPAFAWLYLIIIVLYAGKPRVFRYNVL